MIDFGTTSKFYVQIFSSPHSEEIILTSEFFSSLHDAKEFVNWLSHQMTGFIPYRVVELIYNDYFSIEEPYPRTEMKSHAHFCIHVPPCPLYLDIKKKRRKEREMQGYYYRYSV